MNINLNIKNLLPKGIFILVACGCLAGEADLNKLIWKGATEKAISILNEHPEMINLAENEYSISPAHIAAKTGNNELLKYLIKNGAELEHLDKDGRPVIAKAILGEHPSTVKLLLKAGSKLDWQDKDGTTPLIFASYAGDPEMIALLLEGGAVDHINQSNKWEWTPLMHLARKGKVESAKLLLDKGADAGKTDSDGNNALLLASKSGALELIEPLITAGASVDAKEIRSGKNALHFAAMNGYGKICKTLMDNGLTIDAVDSDNKSAKDYLNRYGNFPWKGEETTEVAKADPTPMPGEAKVIYSGHSGWIVKTQNHILVFDYWKPNQAPDFPGLANGYLTKADTGGLPVTVFTSHEHADHYDVKALKSLVGTSDQVGFVYGFNPKQKEGEGKHVAKVAKADATDLKTEEKGKWKQKTCAAKDSAKIEKNR